MMIRSFVAVARRTSSIVVKRTLAPPSQPINIQDLGRFFCTQPSNEGIKTENCGTIEDDDDDIEKLLSSHPDIVSLLDGATQSQ